MTLPNDISRCSGENSKQICPERDTCLRYKALETPSDWHVLHSQFYVSEDKVCKNKWTF